MTRRAIVAAVVAWVLLLTSAASGANRRDGAFEWGFAAYVCEPGSTVLGYLEATAHAKEYGVSGVNYMRVKFLRQYRGEDSVWHTDSSSTATSATFANTSANRVFEPTERFDFTIDDVMAGAALRIQAEVSWWDRRAGTDRRLARKRVSGAGCTPTLIPPG